MNQTITARYENGVFLPMEKVSLPDHALIHLIITDAPTPKPSKPLKGMLTGLGINVAEGDINELRSEMWQKFPRDIS